MRKLLITIVAALTAVMGLNAQGRYYGEGGFGVKVAWDLNSPVTNLPNWGNGSGISAGVVYDIPLARQFSFEPGLSFFYNTMDIEALPLVLDGKELLSDATFRNTGFRVPMIFLYRINLVDDIAMSVFTGPQFNLGLGARFHYKYAPDQGLYGDGYNRFDMQWLFGIRMHYLDDFFAEIGGGIGITNILTGSDNKGNHLRRNTFTIGVGYMF